MLKFLGMAIVLGVCGYLGGLEKQSLKARVAQLQSLGFAVKNMESQMGYGRETMNVILDKVAGHCGGVIGELLQEVSADLAAADGRVLEEIWQDKLEKFHDKLALDEEDLRLLAEFACGLGVSHTEDQLNKLRSVGLQLEQQQMQAAEKCERLGKVFQSFGWCLGLVLVLLLI